MGGLEEDSHEFIPESGTIANKTSEVKLFILTLVLTSETIQYMGLATLELIC